MSRPATEAEIRARFHANTRPVDGGHLDWTGPERIPWRRRNWRPAALAYYLRTGRHPDGYTTADCGHPGCVQLSHVEDAPGRCHTREALRAVRGITPSHTCRHGHDPSGARYTPTGRPYCETCRRERTAA